MKFIYNYPQFFLTILLLKKKERLFSQKRMCDENNLFI